MYFSGSYSKYSSIDTEAEGKKCCESKRLT